MYYQTTHEEGIRRFYDPLNNLDPIEIPTETAQHMCYCNLAYEAGTNGYCGGDTGHGGRTYLRLEEVGSGEVDMYVRVNGGAKVDCTKLEIFFGGDDELDAIKKCLKFMLETLEKQSPTDRGEVKDAKSLQTPLEERPAHRRVSKRISTK